MPCPCCPAADVPAVDAARQRARLTPEHVAVLGDVLAGHPARDEHRSGRQQLQEAGLLVGDGAMHPVLAAVVGTLARAELLVDVETSGPDGASGHGLSISGRQGCLVQGWPGRDEAEYALLAPGLAVPALAVICGLTAGDLSTDQVRVPVEAPLRLVDGALDALAAVGSGGWDAALSAAVDVVHAELPDRDEAARLVAVLAGLRRALRFTLSLPGAAAPAGVLVVLDAGPQGWWVRTAPAEPLLPDAAADRDQPVRLEPRTAGELWTALVELFPATT